MKYCVKPTVTVTAYKIKAVTKTNDGRTLIELDDGNPPFQLQEGQISRMKPAVGDYYVITADGYEYLNPKDVFEGKYEPLTEDASFHQDSEVAA